MNTYRQNVVDVLQLFASKTEQLELFEAEEENLFVPDVLLSRWEQIYRPEKTQFQVGFSAEEVHDLSCFYDFVLARVNEFPRGGFTTLMTDLYWDSVCRLAETTLETLAKNEEVES